MHSIKAKPPESTWTDEQWQAIVKRDKNLLVSAAAGSGKTAVLVERIINRILDEADEVDVSRLLVVTFTNAAAAEMRKRLADALQKELVKQPESYYLRKQLSLLQKANISTLHSFCLEVVQSYYYQIDLDPSFRIADETEILLLMEECLDRCLEDWYAGDSQDFTRLVESYSNDRSDAQLRHYVMKLYQFALSHPTPIYWLKSLQQQYTDEGSKQVITDIAGYFLQDTAQKLDKMEQKLQELHRMCLEADGPLPYAENLLEDIQGIKQLQAACQEGWNSLLERLQHFSFGALSRKKHESSPEKKEFVKEGRNAVKQQLKKLEEDIFHRSLEHYSEDLLSLAPLVDTLIALVIDFHERFQGAKRERSLIDFSDLEHYALAILGEQKDGQYEPSAVAQSYQQKFLEVYVDEYQDTNHVQETILSLIVNGLADQQRASMFMVGDVKQSIYRFRMAEPGLFLQKYATLGSVLTGEKIDLNRNFRSRQEVLAGINFIFRQLMNPEVGEITYDKQAELYPGAKYAGDGEEVELLIIDKQPEITVEGIQDQEMVGKPFEQDDEQDREEALAEADFLNIQLEARVIGDRILQLMGKRGTERKLVYDVKRGEHRPLEWRDIVILLRANANMTTPLIEELKLQGIPVYADLSTGYFQATEIETMLSVLRLIDNPYQDIPLASVLRSSIVGLNAKQLASIRLVNKEGSYYQALHSYLELEEEDASKPFKWRLKRFYEQLQGWRDFARQSSVAELIKQIYEDTGYYDYAGGLPGGEQRQANLRALLDRAKQYESTSFRGLFRFLRFIDKMRELGKDLGAARALGEQEDVVRVMTIHKSKGLEFPIVFVAGMTKQFNQQELRERMLLHKELGLATRCIDLERRIVYPTLPYLYLQQRIKQESIAEEMRVLYVALTRAKEKLYLVGTVHDFQARLKKWNQSMQSEGWLLDPDLRLNAKHYLDWIGPAVSRHKAVKEALAPLLIPEELERFHAVADVYTDPARFRIEIIRIDQFHDEEAAAYSLDREETLQRLYRGEPVELEDIQPELVEQIQRRLSWQYPYQESVETFAKHSVSEIKKKRQSQEQAYSRPFTQQAKLAYDRPKFLRSGELKATEIGTAMHMVMQHLPFDRSYTKIELEELLADLVDREILTLEEARHIHVDALVLFYQSEMFKLISRARVYYKEQPFTYAYTMSKSTEQHQSALGHAQASVPSIIQGVIDLLVETEEGFVLIDYKTDAVTGKYTDDNALFREMERRYAVQLELYSQAVEAIWQRPVLHQFIFLMDGGKVLEINQSK